MFKNNDIDSKFKAISSLLNKLKINASTYLDLGSGDGSLTQLIAKTVGAREYYCVDIDIKALKAASLKGCKIYNIDLDIEKLPFSDGFFDLVTAFNVIEHLRNPDNMLREVRRVLKKRGFFMLSTPNIASWYNRLLLLFGEPPLGIDLSTEWRYCYPFGVKSTISGHVRMYTLKALTRLLEHHGFKAIAYKGFPQIWKKTQPKGVLKLISVLDKLLSKYSKLAPNILILSMK